MRSDIIAIVLNLLLFTNINNFIMKMYSVGFVLFDANKGTSQLPERRFKIELHEMNVH